MNYLMIIIVGIMYILTFCSVYFFNKNKKVLSGLNIVTLLSIGLIAFIPLIDHDSKFRIIIGFIVSLASINIIELILINIFTFLGRKSNKKVISVLFFIVYLSINLPMMGSIYNLYVSNDLMNVSILTPIYKITLLIVGLVFININNDKNLNTPFDITKIFKSFVVLSLFLVSVFFIWKLFNTGMTIKNTYSIFPEHIDMIYKKIGSRLDKGFSPSFIEYEIYWEYSIISWLLMSYFIVYFHFKKVKVLSILNIIFYSVFILNIINNLIRLIKFDGTVRYGCGPSLLHEIGFMFSVYFFILVIINVSVYLLKNVKKESVKLIYISVFLLLNVGSILNLIINIKEISLKYLMYSIPYLLLWLIGYLIINRYEDVEINKSKFKRYMIIMFMITTVIIGIMYYIHNTYDIYGLYHNFRILGKYKKITPEMINLMYNN